jgi:hypothetical protein
MGYAENECLDPPEHDERLQERADELLHGDYDPNDTANLLEALSELESWQMDELAALMRGGRLKDWGAKAWGHSEAYWEKRAWERAEAESREAAQRGWEEFMDERAWERSHAAF